jgi:hypothetical protein
LCKINQDFENYVEFEPKWQMHIDGSRQILDDLSTKVTLIKESLKENIQKFYAEMSDEYSSYSDYSESTSISEEEEEEEEEEEASN